MGTAIGIVLISLFAVTLVMAAATVIARVVHQKRGTDHA